MRSKFGDGLAQLLSGVREAVEAEDAKGDWQAKEDVYASIAAFLADKLGGEARHWLPAVHVLVGEDDPSAFPEAPAERLELAKELLLVVNIHYLDQGHAWERQLEVYFRNGDQPGLWRERRETSRDGLPSDVREESLRNPAPRYSFRLFPSNGG